MAEKEQNARLEIMRQETDQKNTLVEIAKQECVENSTAQRFGQIAGLVICIICIFLGFIAFILNADWKIVCGFLVIPSASLILALMGKRSYQNKNKDQE